MESGKTTDSKSTSKLDHSKKLDQEKRIKDLQVLESELKSLKKGARVYKQQQNSGVFFKEDKARVFSEAKKELDDLMKEYQEVERGNDNQLEEDAQ